MENRSGSSLICAAMLLASGACNCGRPGESTLVGSVGVPQTVPSLNFGTVQVGQSAALQLPLSNTGTSPLQILSQTVAGTTFSEATLLPSGLAAGAQAGAVLAFSPTAVGKVTGTLTVADDGNPGQVIVSLSGTGVELALSVMPASLDFGQVPVGVSPSPSQTVTFENKNADAVYLTLSTAGTAAQYSLKSAGAAIPATPITLAPNGSYVVAVTYAPTAIAIFNSTFTYTACQDAASTVCLTPQPYLLSGQGVGGRAVFSPNPISFSGVPDGTTPSQTVTLTNAGGAAAAVSCIYLESLGPTACGKPSKLFTLGTPSQVLPATLAPNGNLTLPITYAASIGNGTDVLAATYTTQGAATAATATDSILATQFPVPCDIAISPAAIDFDQVAVGTPLTQSVTLTNSGNLSCTVTGIAIDPASDASYALATGQATSLTLAGISDAGVAGSSATIGVTFNLNNGKPPLTRKGLLDFASNDPLQPSVQVPMLATLATPYAGGGAWPRWHHDNLQSGLSPNDTSLLAGNVAWTADVGKPTALLYSAAESDYLNSPVVGTDGTVYQVGWEGDLYAFHPDGGAAWATLLEGPLSDPHPSTPIIASDGNLYVAFGEFTGSPAFYQVSSAGKVLKTVSAVGEGDGFDLPPILTNAGMLIGADDLSGAFAFSITGGSTFTLAATVSVPTIAFTGDGDQISAVVGSNDTTYLCEGGFICTALTSPATGFKQAVWPAAGLAIPSAVAGSNASDMALDEEFTGYLFILFGGTGGLYSVAASPQEVVAVNPATAGIVWTKPLPAPTSAQSRQGGFTADATAGNSCPAIGLDGTIYVGNYDGLHALAGATGAEKTGFPFLTTSDVLTAAAIGADGTIFFGTADGTFYAIHPDGTLRFKVTAGGRIAGSPAIGPGGLVYFVADDGKLYAVE